MKTVCRDHHDCPGSLTNAAFDGFITTRTRISRIPDPDRDTLTVINQAVIPEMVDGHYTVHARS
jgi:hypothetical protein